MNFAHTKYALIVVPLLATKCREREKKMCGKSVREKREKSDLISCFEYELFVVIWKQSNDYDKFVCFSWQYIRIVFVDGFFFIHHQMDIQISFFFSLSLDICLSCNDVFVVTAARVQRCASMDTYQRIAFIITLTTSCHVKIIIIVIFDAIAATAIVFVLFAVGIFCINTL